MLGVSTRKVKAITEELCGHSFGASTIGRINKQLDRELRKLAKRQLEEEYLYLILDRAHVNKCVNRVRRRPSILLH
jgi:putative transposase